EDLRSHIGWVSQEPVLFHGTIRENLLFGLDADEREDGNDTSLFDYEDETQEEADTSRKTNGGLFVVDKKKMKKVMPAIGMKPEDVNS
ncbi:unnamed protein product, partial [Amoebophrya sp. A25]